MKNSLPERSGGFRKNEAREKYDPPAIIFEKKVEAVANTCSHDPPLTKDSVPNGCTGLTFS